MTHEEAMEKVQKLLRLAKSDNVNEASIAAAMAQKIIDLHKLDVASLGDKEDTEEVNNNHAPLDIKASPWKCWLGRELCILNAVKAYRDREAFMLIGRKSDVEVVRYMYGWLVKEIEGLVKKSPRGMGRTYYNSFRLGAVKAIIERLKSQKEVTETEARAKGLELGGAEGLAQVNNAIVRVSQGIELANKWAKLNLHLRHVASSRVTVDADGRAAGYAAGQSVGLGGSKGLNSGLKALGS